MAYFDSLQVAEFDGDKFPYLELEVTGEARVGEHYARFRPGAELEDHARDLYKVRVLGIFDTKVRGYGDLIETLQSLRRKFDALKTGKLTVPTLGTFNAKALQWKISTKPTASRSGMLVEMQFTEDSTNVDLLEGRALPKNAVSIDAAAQELVNEAKALPVSPDFLEVLLDIVDQCLEVKAMIEVESALVEAKIRSVLEVMRQVDNTAQELQHPEAWGIVDAMHALGGALGDLSDTFGASDEVRTYVVTRPMTIQELSFALYNDSAHASDLRNLNPVLEDADGVIKAGLVVRYFAEAA